MGAQLSEVSLFGVETVLYQEWERYSHLERDACVVNCQMTK